MTGIYKPNHFRIEELVYPEFYEAHKHRGELMWMAFDQRALITLDWLRETYGPITVNDWLWGGPFKYSGLRPFDCEEGSELSQHKFGRAFDCKFKNVTADEVRADMRRVGCMEPKVNRDSLPLRYRYIRRIEEFPGMSWFHFDTGNWDDLKYGVRVVGG
ncbi:peptidase M15 [Maridesulfovibrio ferrireducens]|uniref:peptidase M15 n=1 Tax=Maridesulfovibrio ferrireducens TaxID=246191 RepID=UPI001A1E1322|nr:peptidase M15 [Maridesulfovibrio ferrireducens]MBI9113252.1 peptidase M15 [Maridesulfovibrio ferrireducens]